MSHFASSLIESPPAKQGGTVTASPKWEPSVSKEIKYYRTQLYSFVSSFMLNQCPPKQCYIDKVGGSLYFLRCKGSQHGGSCPFSVRCTVCHTDSTMVTISGYNPNHTNCGAAAVSPSLEDLTQMHDLCSFARKTDKLKDIIEFARLHCSVPMELSTAMASRLKQELLNEPCSEYSIGFSAVSDFLDQFVKLNPSARSLFRRNETSKEFEACFLLFPGVAQILKYSWENTLALDMGFIVTKKGFGANMVALSISTSEHITMSIGTGIVGIENSQNYSICLDTVNQNEEVKLLINTKERVIRFDRHRSIPKAVNIAYPEALKANDPIHIVRNVLVNCGAKSNVRSLWSAMYALTKVDFDKHWDQLVKDSPKVVHYLRNLEVHKYCMYPLVESGVKLYGVYTSNAGEITIAAADRIDARHVEPTKHVSLMAKKFSDKVCYHQLIIQKSVEMGAILIPYANDHYLRCQKDRHGYTVTIPGNGSLNVVSVSYNGEERYRREVNMNPPEGEIATCSKCYLSHQQQHNWPCKHVVAAAVELLSKKHPQWIKLSESERLSRMFGCEYLISTLHKAFDGIVVNRPLFSNLRRDDTIAPLPTVKPGKGGSLRRTRFKSHVETFYAVGDKRKRTDQSLSGNYRCSHTVRKVGEVPKRMRVESNTSSVQYTRAGDDITVDYPIDSDSEDEEEDSADEYNDDAADDVTEGGETPIDGAATDTSTISYAVGSRETICARGPVLNTINEHSGATSTITSSAAAEKDEYKDNDDSCVFVPAERVTSMLTSLPFNISKIVM